MKRGRASMNASPAVTGQVNSAIVSPLRVLIVDDEPIARKVLREELDLMDTVEVIGEAENGAAALSMMSSAAPDLVFLDVQMPVMNGFELLGQMRGGHMPAFVMVTAYDQHAIRAFEAGAVDYLLKPVSQERLGKALDRARALRGRMRHVAESLAHLSEMPGPPGAPPRRKVVGR